MPVEHSEFKIVKLLDKATPKLLSEDAFVGTDAGPDTLEPCFVKSWSTSGDADDRPTESHLDNGADTFDFSQSTTEPTAANSVSKTMDWGSTRLLGPGGGFGDDPIDANADLLATPGPDDDVGYDWPGEYAQRFDGVDQAGFEMFAMSYAQIDLYY